ncbi:MAG: NFACT family protein [Oscillospiraceae bacterium]|nr:NFACT family protein [Oscillospiraceae bacterium]
MAFDAVLLRETVVELNEMLTGGKITGVSMPSGDMIVFSVRKGGENFNLLFRAVCGRAGINISSSRFEKTKEGPSFLTLLRKHIQGSDILSFSMPGDDRVCAIALDCADYLGYREERTLYLEFAGKVPNAILTDPDGNITDCLRKSELGSYYRALVPGMKYVLPAPQNKINFLNADHETVEDTLRSWNGESPFDKFLMSSFSGLAPLVCREAHTAQFMLDLKKASDSHTLKPFAVKVNGKFRDFSYMEIRQYGSGSENVCFSSFNEMLDNFYRDSDAEAIKKKADLITANIWRLKKGDRVLECEDYYDNGKPVKVELDPLLDGPSNAALYYKKYKKLKNAEKYLNEQIILAENEKKYLESVLYEIDKAETSDELSAIKAELVSSGYIRQDRKSANHKKAQNKTARIEKIRTASGFDIYIGKNNIQNDELRSLGRKSDLWFHVKDYHGSHVLLCTYGMEPSEKDILEAAKAAAEHSEISGQNALVDFTQLKYVKKPSGAKPGFVTYTNQKTLVIQP